MTAATANADREETPAQITQRSQKEAIRRYPALGIKNSPENLLFIEMYRELRNTNSELLKDPEWPLDVAQMLARKEGWGKESAAPAAPPSEEEPETPIEALPASEEPSE